MIRKALLTITFVSASQLAFAQAGGNIALTGHDSDFHPSSGANAQLAGMFAFARAAAPNPTLPVLVFDHGSQLTAKLTTLGIPYTRIDPDIGVPAASNFNVAVYSAMAVASDSTCGGCSNTLTSIANLTAAAPAIRAFLDARGGIVALTGASNAATYYGFLPASAAGAGSPPSNGFEQTPYGASIGIPAVNGDATHNFFPRPGFGGVSAAYGTVEQLITPPVDPDRRIVTIACSACSTAIIVPTMPQWLFLGLAVLLAIGVALTLRLRPQHQQHA